MRGIGRRAVASVAVVLTAGVLAAPPSWAEPFGDDDVAAARSAVAGTARAVAAIELELSVQSATLDQAWTAVAAAAEDYTAALVARDEAAVASRVAEARAAEALAEVELARAVLGGIALEAHRSGGSLDGLSAFLSADGFDDLVARTDALAHLGDRAQQAVQRFEAAELVASTLRARADVAARAAQQTTVAAQDALDGARAAESAAQEQVAQIAAQREVLLAELAERRQTSLAVERARQATLDAERQARVEAAAAASRGATATPVTAPPVTAPPVTAPPVTAPPVAAPPVTAPPVTSPPVTAPPVTSPPVTAPPTTAPPAVTPVVPPPTTADPYGLGTGSLRGSAAQGVSAVAWATAQVGKAYGYGAAGPDAFDCSGLTSQAWKAAGVSLNRTSRDQYRQVRKITYDSIRPGDLIFYGSVGSDPGSIGHVAMYVGSGQMVEAPRPGVPVRVTSVRWSGTMPFAGRP